eukprot:Sspe_Gene.25393::Locus_10189_Transcript_1_1_Confidence_1.000_Length_3610::g.25393::m.25393
MRGSSTDPYGLLVLAGVLALLAPALSLPTKEGASPLSPRLLDHDDDPHTLDTRTHLVVYFDHRAPRDASTLASALGSPHAAPMSDKGYLVFASIRQLLSARESHGWNAVWFSALQASDKVHSTVRSGRLHVVLSEIPKDIAEWPNHLARRGIDVEHFAVVGRNKVAIHVPPAQGAEAASLLASHCCVRWIEGAAQYSVSNMHAVPSLQQQLPRRSTVPPVRYPLWAQGINGTGEVVQVGDTGLAYNSCFFKDNTESVAFYPSTNPRHRKILTYQECEVGEIRDSEDKQGHGTHVCGSVAGKATSHAMADNDGLATGAKLFITDLACADAGIRLPGDLVDYYSPAYSAGAGVSQNSWGSEKPLRYETSLRETDAFAYEHPTFLMVFAVGNSRKKGVQAPGAAKNVLAVGSHTNTGDDAISLSILTAFGPTWDKRVKPDVLAPGEPVASAGTAECTIEDKSGTSMASPFASASALLLRQYLREGRQGNGQPNATLAVTPTASLIKALLIHSAQPLSKDQHAPDNQQGWGALRLGHLLYLGGPHPSHLHFVNNATVGHRGTYQLCFTTAPDDEDFSRGVRVTLVWTDPPAFDGALSALVNDLDLVVVAPDGAVHYGNMGTHPDPLNVVERVDLAAPAREGAYRVLVIGHSVVEHHPYPAGLPFSLVVTAPLLQVGGNCTAACPGCGGHGVCDATGVCKCDDGWMHANCTVCDAEVLCSGHGECGDGSSCNCSLTFTGERCERCAEGWYGVHCDSQCDCMHGTCDNTTGQCLCEGHWGGRNCDRCRRGWRGQNCTERSHWCVPREVVEVSAPRGWLQINGERTYPNSIRCSWLLQPSDPSSTVIVRFHNFSTEAAYDPLTIYGGNSTASPPIATYSGPRGDFEISFPHAVLMVFQADLYGGKGQEGFEAEYEFSSSDVASLTLPVTPAPELSKGAKLYVVLRSYDMSSSQFVVSEQLQSEMVLAVLSILREGGMEVAEAVVKITLVETFSNGKWHAVHGGPLRHVTTLSGYGDTRLTFAVTVPGSVDREVEREIQALLPAVEPILVPTFKEHVEAVLGFRSWFYATAFTDLGPLTPSPTTASPETQSPVTTTLPLAVQPTAHSSVDRALMVVGASLLVAMGVGLLACARRKTQRLDMHELPPSDLIVPEDTELSPRGDDPTHNRDPASL